MFRIVCKSLHSFATTSKPHKLNTLRLQQYSSPPTNAKKPIPRYVNQDSFSVKYLMNEFGFSLEKAVTASQNYPFESRDKPDAVVAFLKKQGFTQTHIQKIVSARSGFLIYNNPEDILLPKIEFFRSKGFSKTDLAKMIALNHQLLTSSLKQCIIPNFNFLRDLLGSEEDVIRMLKRDSRLLNHPVNRVKPDIKILIGAGVPYSSITYLLRNRTRLFCYGPDKLKVSVEEIQKLGIDPQSSSFREALYNLTVTPKSIMNEKMEAYKRWGCSEDEVFSSFKIQPVILGISVEKIDGIMSFFVNEIGLEPSEVLRRYNLLMCSLSKRIMPRWSIYQELVSKGLAEKEGKLKETIKEGKLTSLFYSSEKLFLDKYVNSYKDEAPLLLKLYHEKLKASK